MGISVID